jgi:hypothetical protein
LEALALQEELYCLTNDGLIVGKENTNCHRARPLSVLGGP